MKKSIFIGMQNYKKYPCASCEDVKKELYLCVNNYNEAVKKYEKTGGECAYCFSEKIVETMKNKIKVKTNNEEAYVQCNCGYKTNTLYLYNEEELCEICLTELLSKKVNPRIKK